MSRNPSDPQTLRCSPIHSGENVTGTDRELC